MSEENGKVRNLRLTTRRLDPYAELFKLREESIEDESLREVYETLVSRMRHDASVHGVSGAVEMLMIERVAFEYIWMRDRERLGIGVNGIHPANPDLTPGFTHERSWRDTIAQWYELAHRLQRALAREEPDASFVRDQVLREAGVVIAQVCDSYPEDVAAEMKEKFAEAFDELEEASAV